MEQHGVVRSGWPFVRIVTSDMSAELDIEVGVPVDSASSSDERFLVGLDSRRHLRHALLHAPRMITTTTRRTSTCRRGPRTKVWRGTSIAAAASTCGSGDSSSIRPDLSSDDGMVFELIYKVIDPAD